VTEPCPGSSLVEIAHPRVEQRGGCGPVQEAYGVFEILARLEFHDDPARLDHSHDEADQLGKGGGGNRPSRIPSIASMPDRPIATFATGAGTCHSTTRSRRPAGENRSS
jgi:hypothetical protein